MTNIHKRQLCLLELLIICKTKTNWTPSNHNVNIKQKFHKTSINSNIKLQTKLKKHNYTQNMYTPPKLLLSFFFIHFFMTWNLAKA